jgi:hypothetical protein
MKSAIDKLLEICDMESDTSKVGWKRRREAMESWIQDHTVICDTELSVINPQVFQSEFMDFIKEKLVEQASIELTTYTSYDIKDKKISAKITILKE